MAETRDQDQGHCGQRYHSRQQSEIADRLDHRCGICDAADQDRGTGDQQQGNQTDHSVDYNSRNCFGTPSRLFPGDEECLEQVTTHTADADKIQQVGNEAKSKSIRQGERQIQCTDQQVPPHKARADRCHYQSESDAQR